MKKVFLTLLASVASVSLASAQLEIGLKVSPAITNIRTDATADQEFVSKSAKFNLGGALVADYFFGQNAAFSTGLALTGKGGTITYRGSALGAGAITREQDISVQYLELPLSIKLFTNEIATDIRLYFQVGGSLATPIGAKINGSKRYTDPDTNVEAKALTHIFFFDANALAGLGAEYQLGQTTKFFGGFSYHRGLVNMDSYFGDERKSDFKDVILKNNVFALDLGLKF